MAAVWLRVRGRGKLGQSLMVTVGATFILVGIGAITYASVWFHPATAKADNADLNQREPAPPQNVDNRGGIIIGGNNSGNATINNYGPPPSTLKSVVDKPLVKMSDGKYVRKSVFDVIGTSPPAHVIVTADGENVSSLMIIAHGGFSQQREGTHGNTHFIDLVTPAPGRYEIQLIQTDDKPASLQALIP